MGEKSNPRGLLWRRIRQAEVEAILEALEKAAGSVPLAAKLLGIEESGLYKKLDSLQLAPKLRMIRASLQSSSSATRKKQQTTS